MMSLILVGLVAIWFASAWLVVRIGAANGRDINSDVLDGALMLGPFTFFVIVYGRHEDRINRLIRRVRRWFTI